MTTSSNADRELVRAALLESAAVKRVLAERHEQAIVELARAMAETLTQGGKVLIFGNGGSAADAQHFAGELVGRFKARGRPPYPVVALTTDTSVLTCLANDFSFDEVFSRQVQALARRGDVVVGISTSGRSANVLRGIEAAKAAGARTIGFTGADGGAIAASAELALQVPSTDTQRIQEAHITILHVLAELVERALVQ